MEKLSLEEALGLLTRPGRTAGPGRVSKGAKLVQDFLSSDALFARQSFSNEKDRQANMLSVKKYLKDSQQENKVWVVADGHSIVFTNMEKARQAEDESGKAIVEAFNAFTARYANVGRKGATVAPKKK